MSVGFPMSRATITCLIQTAVGCLLTFDLGGAGLLPGAADQTLVARAGWAGHCLVKALWANACGKSEKSRPQNYVSGGTR